MSSVLERTIVPSSVTPDEWKLRCELAALYRLLAHHRMTDQIFTHISAKLPGDEGHFLINPYGMLFSEIKASDLIKIDIDGNIIDAGFKSEYGVNKAGFVIHSAIHGARHDLVCVVHTHTQAGVAVSIQKEGLLPISQHALKFYGNLAYHSYEGIALDLDERESLVKDLGEHRAMILKNHGLLVAGRTVAEAFDHIFYLERACQIQISALSAGRDYIELPPEEVRVRTAGQFNMRGEQRPHVDLAWRAALRDAGIAGSDTYS